MANEQVINPNLKGIIDVLTHEQKTFIDDMTLPSVMEIKVLTDFDTPFVQTTSDRWTFERTTTEQNYIFDLNPHLNKLLKVLAVKHADTHIAPLDSKRFSELKRIFRQVESFSFETFDQLLKTYSTSSKNSNIYYDMRCSVRVMIRMGFPLFDIDNLETLEHLPRQILS